MSVRARILAIRITEKVEKKPEVAHALGITANLISRKDVTPATALNPS